jgi:hypothetical protein
MLGFAYEAGRGVPQDFSEAMRWYQIAYAGKVPHAACRIAGLYSDGKGVGQSLDEAVRWYQLEADQWGCPTAQYNVGRDFEAKSAWPEALRRYRNSAERGYTDAQVRLGELLSDGFTVPPDYVEASQWLILATEGRTNRLAEVQLRRVKAKLTAEQLNEAQRRAEAVMKRLRDENSPTKSES